MAPYYGRVLLGSGAIPVPATLTPKAPVNSKVSEPVRTDNVKGRECRGFYPEYAHNTRVIVVISGSAYSSFGFFGEMWIPKMRHTKRCQQAPGK